MIMRASAAMASKSALCCCLAMRSMVSAHLLSASLNIWRSSNQSVCTCTHENYRQCTIVKCTITAVLCLDLLSFLCPTEAGLAHACCK